MRDKKIFWIDNDRKYMRQGDWKRPVTDESFFLDKKLEWMERNGIGHEVLLTLSQLYCNGVERSLTKDILRFQNDFSAEVQSEYPEKFTTGFVVQPAYVDDALAEIERCVEKNNLQLLCLPTHFLDSGGQWVSVADKSVEPIFELINKYGLAVEIHPYDGPRMINLKNEYWRFHLVWMCAQTADAYHFFTLFDYPEKYPNMRTCFAHGNQYGQVNIGRRVQGYEGRPDLFKGAVHPNKSLRAKNMFYDTLVHDIYSLRLLVERQGAGQIVAGLDDPYPLGEMGTVPNCYPGKVIDEAVEFGILTKKEKERIWLDNVVDWIAGEEGEVFKKRLGI